MSNTKITKIHARQILDSRGNPTVEVEVTAGGFMARASVPSGASTGSFEAVELRDGDKSIYCGKSVYKAVENVNNIISEKLVGMDVMEQEKIDRKMIALDGTENKGNLGANAILGVSLACAKVKAMIEGKELFESIGGELARLLPVPMMNIINGGKHADNSLNIQEFMIMPIGAKDYSTALRWSVEVFHTLKGILKSKGLSTAVGDEGGFAPKLENDEQALKLLVEAIEKAGFKPREDFVIALDVASTEMWEEAQKIDKAGKYYFWKTGELFTSDELISYYEEMSHKYPIISIEDGLAEEDWDNWKKMTDRLGTKMQLVGDDLFVTNTKRIEKGIDLAIANAVLIKLNQIGTLTETIDAVRMAQQNKYSTIISHRSGETEDATIADLAVALSSGQIKIGAPSRTDRVCKYNQLLRIDELLGHKAMYAGRTIFADYLK